MTGGVPTILLSFNSITNGFAPYGSLTLSGSTLYGMTWGGNRAGTVFSVPTSGGAPTTLLAFSGSNGGYPWGSLTLSGSTLYGMTCSGGANDDGTIFSIGTDGSGFHSLFSFSGSNGLFPYGSNPKGNLTLIGSTLYGMTEFGGAATDGVGTIFSIPISGGTVTSLLSFSGTTGYYPTGSLTAISAAAVAVANAVNGTIISGGSAAMGATVTNSARNSTLYGTASWGGSAGGKNGTVFSLAVSGANDLDYTMAAAVQNGSATLGAITSGTGNLAPSTSQSCTVSVTSTSLGINTISFTASDPNSSNLSQTTTATLTVLDHSNASLSSSATQTTQTINFGNVLRGATIPSRNFTIYNRAANTAAAYTANLKLTGFTPTGDSAWTANL